jgi:uncharacterized membrane protein YhaH (DUF805 family)
LSKIIDYLLQACHGISNYLTNNHYFVLLVAVLLVLWLTEKKQANERQNRLLIYTLIMLVLLLCPITAVAVMIYQTAFYEYVWAWSMVPITAVVAFGLVLFWNQKGSKMQKRGLIILSIVFLCLIGNQGNIQKMPDSEAKARGEVEEVIRELFSLEADGECILWAPQRLMQEIRRQDGRVILLYGRDMWDQKAGAYDYEAYTPEVTEAYRWLEKAMEYSDFAVSLEEPKEAIALLDEQYMWSREAKENIEQILQAGANTIVWPNLLSEYMEQLIIEIAQEQGKQLQKAYTEEYTIYVIN